MPSMEDLLLLSDVEHFGDWLERLKRLTGQLGYSNLLLCLRPGPSSANQQLIMHTDYPPAWRVRYDNHAYADIDPVVHHCLGANSPLVWARENYRRPTESAFFEEASMYGLGQGVALPLHGPRGEVGMFCLKPDENCGSSSVTIIHSLPMLALLRDHAIERLLGGPAHQQGRVHLTSREKEVLQWSAAGKTTWEISMILGCTSSAVDFHFKNVRRKFQVGSRQLAVLKAFQQKLITA